MTLGKQTISVIGAGNIGRALIGGLLRNDFVAPASIRATRRGAQAREQLQRSFPGVLTGCENGWAAEGASLIVIAVKPQNATTVIQEIRGKVGANTLIVSVLAGLRTETICAAFGQPLPVVRTMPNTPMLVEEGATAIAAGRHATREQLDVVRSMFEAVGTVEVVPEDMMDVVTGLSGSGPAYVYMLIEALTDAGVKQGLLRPTAFRLATQTVLGAAKLVSKTGKHPAILRDEVTTPGGTAIAAIGELEAHGLRTMFINAVATATNRSKELSELFT